jgi:hypothetical protein
LQQKAIETLDDMLTNPLATPSIKVRAATAILDHLRARDIQAR